MSQSNQKVFFEVAMLNSDALDRLHRLEAEGILKRIDNMVPDVTLNKGAVRLLCPDCGGTGEGKNDSGNSSVVPCPTCGGSRSVGSPKIDELLKIDKLQEELLSKEAYVSYGHYRSLVNKDIRDSYSLHTLDGVIGRPIAADSLINALEKALIHLEWQSTEPKLD